MEVVAWEGCEGWGSKRDSKKSGMKVSLFFLTLWKIMHNTHMTTLATPEAEYPYIELSQKLRTFWMSLSEEHRKRVGADVTMIIGFQGNSLWLMEIIWDTIQRIVPQAESDFYTILWTFYACPEEVRQAAQSQLTEYFTSHNR